MRYGKSAAGLSSRSINPESSANITSTVMTAFFAAVIFLGIQSFRIPLPRLWEHRFYILVIFLLCWQLSAWAGGARRLLRF